jgi:hypothetical protein
VCSILTVILAFTVSARPLNWVTDVAAQVLSAQSSQPREQAPSNMQDMMKLHEQMMAEMKAADSRLDALVKDMNAATGDAKVNAVAAVVTELVRSAEVHARTDGPDASTDGWARHDDEEVMPPRCTGPGLLQGFRVLHRQAWSVGVGAEHAAVASFRAPCPSALRTFVHD